MVSHIASYKDTVPWHLYTYTFYEMTFGTLCTELILRMWCLSQCWMEVTEPCLHVWCSIKSSECTLVSSNITISQGHSSVTPIYLYSLWNDLWYTNHTKSYSECDVWYNVEWKYVNCAFMHDTILDLANLHAWYWSIDTILSKEDAMSYNMNLFQKSPQGIDICIWTAYMYNAYV